MKYQKCVLKMMSLMIFVVLLGSIASYENYANKFTLEIKESSTFRFSSMKNFAKNLSDTKKLRITQSNLRFGNNVYRSSENNNIYDQSDSNSNNNRILYGSILYDIITHELSFNKEYLDNINFQKTKKVVARARYNKSLDQIGWSKLFVETFDNAPPEYISWGAGYLEGRLTASQILNFYNNLVGIHEKESTYLNDVFKYYENVEKFIRSKTSKESLENIQDLKNLEYWISVAMTQAQSDGLLQGYNSIMKANQFNFSQIYFINADGEVPELLNVFKYKSNKFNNGVHYSFREQSKKNKLEKFSKAYLNEYYGSDDPEIVWQKIMSNSHCSAIIKLIRDENNNPKDIFVGHTTWDSFSEMHRIFKKYSFSYTMYGNEAKKSEVSFSSYPGTLTSTDDFYILNNKIVVLETTLEMLDKTIYEKNMPNADSHVPNYIRISVANRLANSGKEWTEIFKQNNSGTYNSQWMIVDFNRFNTYLKKGASENRMNLINDTSNYKSFINTHQKSRSNYNNFYRDLSDTNTNMPPKTSLFEAFSQVQNNLNNKNKNGSPYSVQESLADDEVINSLYYNTKNPLPPGILNINNLDFSFKQINKNIFNSHMSEVFFILEQVPGYIEIKDMTNHLLDKGFWGSYNRPYFEKVYKESGYYDMMLRYGKTYSYYDNTRAALINHEINKVNTLEDMKNLMQNNASPFDGNHMNALSPRYDLVEHSEVKRPSGGIDSKIVNSNLISSGTVVAKSGPSTANGTKPFNWADWPNEPHDGLPNYWNFGWNYFDDIFIKN